LGSYRPPACSWDGDGCGGTKCCKREAYLCFEQDSEWSDCMPWDGCDPSNGTPTENWSCKFVGPSQGTVEVVQAADDADLAGTSLFCFVVLTPNGIVPGDGVEEGYEEPLLWAVKEKGLGIFSCDQNAVFYGQRADKAEWGSIKNVDVFMDVWHQVQYASNYSEFDWTVKVDADAVFFPDRLKAHLEGLRAPKGAAIYLQNVDYKFKFMGALEVLSKEAVDAFLENKDACRDNLGNDGGEDFWTKSCLDASGVGFMSDYDLLNDKYTKDHIDSLSDVTPCESQTAVAFHPYKSKQYWIACYQVSMGEKSLSDFPGCFSRLPGDPCTWGSGAAHHMTYDADGNVLTDRIY